MIDRNIGTVERLVRFGLAVVIVGWIFTAQSFGLLQGLGLLAAFALLWNSIFGRCYLWKWLGLSSCATEDDCSAGGGDSRA
ncbi:DUF2892 domain-containing protein [Congregibacter variabilis]|uniref:DUF2892 domain-containing protein n=1 Tax=Congregibacter variabilis TaxID=3081200 RepID=A0ABZ0I5X5_9GAMM|nr:DUF2892 domain-containing protein [Congregibacter sp. IMCC43200]